MRRYKGTAARIPTLQDLELEELTKIFPHAERVYAKKKLVSHLRYNGRELPDKKDIQGALVFHYDERFSRGPYSTDPRRNEIINAPYWSNNETQRNIQYSKNRNIAQIKSLEAPSPDGLPENLEKKKKKENCTTTSLCVQRVVRKNKVSYPVNANITHDIIPMPKNSYKLQWVELYRTISLLNCDYQMFAGLLAGRIQDVITQS